MQRRILIGSAPLALAALGLGLPAFAQGIDPTGKFQPIIPPQPTETGDKVEVVDIFWYGCPHCFTFLPHMEAWEKTKPDYIAVRRMPAIFRDSWENHARGFYVAQQLDIVEAIHRPLFEAIHLDGRPMDTADTLAEFFQARAGVTRGDFDKAWKSFSVSTQVAKSKTMQRNYGVRGTPSVVVAGKYLTSGSHAGSYENVLAVVEALAATEHQRAG